MHKKYLNPNYYNSTCISIKTKFIVVRSLKIEINKGRGFSTVKNADSFRLKLQTAMNEVFIGISFIVVRRDGDNDCHTLNQRGQCIILLS